MEKTKPNKIGNLKKRDIVKGDPQKLVHMNWYKNWSGSRRKIMDASRNDGM